MMLNNKKPHAILPWHLWNFRQKHIQAAQAKLCTIDNGKFYQSYRTYSIRSQRQPDSETGTQQREP